MVKTKSILLLSGGLDSTVASHIAKIETHPILALTFDYGQRAASQEKKAAADTSRRIQVPHRIIELPWLRELTKTGLVNAEAKLPEPREKDLDDPVKGRKTAAAVWVPNRNGLFLNIAACFAESMGAELIITGFNAEEGVTFPDNSAAFVRSADDFFWFSTLNKTKVVSYTLEWNKPAIARKALELGVHPSDVWSCYESGPLPCQVCESCLRLARAFREAA